MKFILWTLVWWGLYYVGRYLDLRYIGYKELDERYSEDIQAKAFMVIVVIWILGAIYLH